VSLYVENISPSPLDLGEKGNSRWGIGVMG